MKYARIVHNIPSGDKARKKRETEKDSNSTKMSVVKRPRADDSPGGMAVGRVGAGQVAVTGPTRTSGLRAPNVQLHGHTAEVLAVEFDGSGKHVASASADKTILLWDAYGDNDNYGIITGHKAAVLDVRWSRDGRSIYSASADLTLGTWDVASGTRVRKHVGHEDMVNAVDVVSRGSELVVSGSDDGSVGVWDPREKECTTYFQTEYPVLAVAVDSVGAQVFSGGVEGTISVWDPRRADAPLMTLPGHGDALVTGLRRSPDDQTLASVGADSTVRTWDVRAFGPADRALQVYDGSVAGLEQNLLRPAWSADGSKLAAGSSDRTAVVWETHSRRILYKLAGHLGSVNAVSFSPLEPILASASSDRSIILGEIR